MMLTWKELQGKSDDELIRLYDEKAASTDLGLTLLRDEMLRRDIERSQRQTWWLSVLVAMLTVIYTGVAACQLYFQLNPPAN